MARLSLREKEKGERKKLVDGQRKRKRTQTHLCGYESIVGAIGIAEIPPKITPFLPLKL